MTLLSDADRAALPPLYATEEQGDAAVVWTRFHAPGTLWHWFAVEFDGEDLFFGLVCGWDVEAGYFSLSEMEEAGHVIRDAAWRPRSLGDVRVEVDNARAAL